MDEVTPRAERDRGGVLVAELKVFKRHITHFGHWPVAASIYSNRPALAASHSSADEGTAGWTDSPAILIEHVARIMGGNECRYFLAAMN